MTILENIVSDSVFELSFEWLKEARKEYSANSDVWDLRFCWNEMKSKIQSDLLGKTYRFADGTKTIFCARDALVLKAISLVLSTYLALQIWLRRKLFQFIKSACKLKKHFEI